MPHAVMLFAAGFGTRMGALTADRPKPLIEVAGKPLLDHALELMAGLPTRVVNAHYRAEQVAAHLRRERLRISGRGGIRHWRTLAGTRRRQHASWYRRMLVSMGSRSMSAVPTSAG